MRPIVMPTISIYYVVVGRHDENSLIIFHLFIYRFFIFFRCHCPCVDEYYLLLFSAHLIFTRYFCREKNANDCNGNDGNGTKSSYT